MTCAKREGNCGPGHFRHVQNNLPTTVSGLHENIRRTLLSAGLSGLPRADLLVGKGNFARGHRLRQCGVCRVINGYHAANVKQPTAYTCDLRDVQRMHAEPPGS